MYFFILLAVIISIVIVLFAVQNTGLATITFLTFNFEGSLAFILVVVFALGVLSGLLVTIPSFLRMSAASRGQKRRLKELEKNAAINGASQPPEDMMPPD